jgi:hypothetical protein
MSIIFKKVFFRESNELEFYAESQSFLDHVTSMYINTGKCIRFREKSLITDDLSVQVVESEWADQQGYNEFLSDPLAIADKDLIVNHNRTVGILLVGIDSDA